MCVWPSGSSCHACSLGLSHNTTFSTPALPAVARQCTGMAWRLSPGRAMWGLALATVRLQIAFSQMLQSPSEVEAQLTLNTCTGDNKLSFISSPKSIPLKSSYTCLPTDTSMFWAPAGLSSHLCVVYGHSPLLLTCYQPRKQALPERLIQLRLLPEDNPASMDSQAAQDSRQLFPSVCKLDWINKSAPIIVLTIQHKRQLGLSSVDASCFSYFPPTFLGSGKQ